VACIGLSTLWSFAIRQSVPNLLVMCDFGEIYYGVRCAAQHRDPYDPNATSSLLSRELSAAGDRLPADPAQEAIARSILTLEINLPTCLFLFAPLAILPWAIAQNLWMVLCAGMLAFDAFLIWDLGARRTPFVFLLLAGFLLANCEGVLLVGNSAVLAVSFCIVATWCFLKNRYVLLGAVLLAISLVVKPHDSGFVWLYFLCAGGPLRRRAVQSLAIVSILALCASIWIASVSPHWLQELHRNVSTLSAQHATDPSLAGTTNNGSGLIVDLQAVLSVFWNDPLFYNLMSYFLVGSLITIWALATLTRRATLQGAQVALASIAALSMLPVYHRSNDAKILLLAIPACAMLWTRKGATRWIALALTSASIFFTADIPLAILGELTRHLTIFPSNLPGKLLTILLRRPTPLILLATGCFYLWVYLRHSSPAQSAASNFAATDTVITKAAT